MAVREAHHAGSWYSSTASTLTSQLDGWLTDVPTELPGIGKTPLPGARVIISPHAGYAYSGACAAWAYRSLDLSEAKRIFILHPSHHFSLSTLALPSVEAYATPLSPNPLPLDLATIQHLLSLNVTVNNRTVKFTTMSQSTDEAEHSAEMQLPYLHRLLQKLYPDRPESEYPPLIPIMVGSTNAATESAFGELLAPYIADPASAWIISSDFCHWGSRFGYTYYVPSAPTPAHSRLSLPNGVTHTPAPSSTSVTEGKSQTLHTDPKLYQGRDLAARHGQAPGGNEPTIYESIAHVDRACMCSMVTGSHTALLQVLRGTGNTVCGRHPIGVFMAGWEEVVRKRGQEAGRDDGKDGGEGLAADDTESDVPNAADKSKFRFIRYERSSDVVSARDSSVSYASAFAVLS